MYTRVKLKVKKKHLSRVQNNMTGFDLSVHDKIGMETADAVQKLKMFYLVTKKRFKNAGRAEKMREIIFFLVKNKN